MITLFRRLAERTLWRLFRPKRWKDLPKFSDWAYAVRLDPVEFSNTIGRIHAFSDKKKLPYTFPVSDPQYFFMNLYYDRDADDYARIWTCYCLAHRKPCTEWIVSSGKKHMLVTTMKEEHGFRILSYYRSTKAYDDEITGIKEVVENSINGMQKVKIKKYRRYETN